MLANLVGQVGCVTGLVALIIIGVAFGAGWLLDDWTGNERRFVTVILMVGSFPVTLFAMVRISLWMLQRAQDRVATLDQEEISEETTQT